MLPLCQLYYYSRVLLKLTNFLLDNNSTKIKQKYNEDARILNLTFESENITEIHKIAIDFIINDDYLEYTTNTAFIDGFNSNIPLVTPCYIVNRGE